VGWDMFGGSCVTREMIDENRDSAVTVPRAN
jgi:hypothetical protein